MLDIKEGSHSYVQYVERGPVPKHKMRFDTSIKSLHVLTEKFTFFTPAIAYIYGKLQENILWDFVSSQSEPVHLCFATFDKPVFQGLEINSDVFWNHALWAIDNKQWPTFLTHMCQAVLVDHDTKTVYRYGSHEFQIVDPLKYDNGLVTDMQTVTQIQVHSIGVASSKYSITLVQDTPLAPPKLKRFPADTKSCQYAEVCFKKGITDDAIKEIQG